MDLKSFLPLHCLFSLFMALCWWTDVLNMVKFINVFFYMVCAFYIISRTLPYPEAESYFPVTGLRLSGTALRVLVFYQTIDFCVRWDPILCFLCKEPVSTASSVKKSVLPSASQALLPWQWVRGPCSAPFPAVSCSWSRCLCHLRAQTTES